MWGEPKTIQDICKLFESFCKNSVAALPWCDQPLTSESGSIFEKLATINSKGYLTINSQPAVDGASSSDPVFGWGPKNGYVYQKVKIS